MLASIYNRSIYIFIKHKLDQPLLLLFLAKSLHSHGEVGRRPCVYRAFLWPRSHAWMADRGKRGEWSRTLGRIIRPHLLGHSSVSSDPRWRVMVTQRLQFDRSLNVKLGNEELLQRLKVRLKIGLDV